MVRKVLLFIFCFYVILSAQQYPDKNIHDMLVEGINNIINQDYNKAEDVFKKLKKHYPELPLGDIYLAAAEIAWAYDLKIPYRDSLISSYLDAAENTSEKLLENEPNSLWNKYFIALTEGYSAYYKALKENWIGAFTNGISAADNFKEILSDSAGFYEAYTPIGTYLYWKSKKLESFNWLPFVEDDSDAGISYLEKASQLSIYNRYLAVYSLIWIYIEKKEPLKAVEKAELMLKEYPHSRFFKLAIARAYEDIDKNQAIKIYYEILRSYSKPGLVNEITLKHKIARQYYLLGKKEESLKLCTEILSKKLDIESSGQLESRMEHVNELYSELTK